MRVSVCVLAGAHSLWGLVQCNLQNFPKKSWLWGVLKVGSVGEGVCFGSGEGGELEAWSHPESPAKTLTDLNPTGQSRELALTSRL